MKTRISDLDRDLSFQVRAATDDGHGNERGDFEEQFVMRARIVFLRGGEAVQGARMEARQPAIIVVRSDADTALIRPHWQAVSGDQVFDIRELPSLSEDRLFLEMLATARLSNG